MDIKENIINRLRETKRDNIETVIEYMENHEFSPYSTTIAILPE